QEQIENREEPELQADGDWLEHRLLFQLEREGRGANLDLVAGLENLWTVNSPPVQRRAVGRAEVAQHPGATARSYLGVLARHVRILYDDVALTAASHRRARRADHNPFAVHQQQSRLDPCAGSLLEGLGHT